MNYLFLETALTNRVELLDDHFQSLGHVLLSPREASQKLHQVVLSYLNQNNISMKNLSAVITVAGPGSYTGLRLAEGFIQVSAWCGIPSFSFYLHQIPHLLGHKNYYWFSKAFKGEYFFYEFLEGQERQQRFREIAELENIKSGPRIFADEQDLFTEMGLREVLSIKPELENLNKKYLEEIVGERQRKEIFYYRNALEEFKPSQK